MFTPFNCTIKISQHKQIIYKISLLFISTFLYVISCNAQNNNLNKTFSFNLKAAASTSAGVYTDSGYLIKTLWSGEKYTAGSHTANWDGTDDIGKLVSKGSYQIKVLSNNVKYSWEGVMGNTSDSLTGNTVYRSHLPICGIAIAGNSTYYATYYNETGASTSKFLNNKPQKRIPLFGKGMATRTVTTDGEMVYWAGNDAAGSTCWVFGSRSSDDSEITFTNGKPYKARYGRTYISCIDINSDPNAATTGMAVQKKGACLIVAHGKLNVINVYNKVTGALMKTIPLSNPGPMVVDGDDMAWITLAVNGKQQVQRFKIGTDGSLSPSNVSLSNLLNPVALAVSPDNKILLVADAGDSQQLKAYNPHSGSFEWIFGKAHGYAASATVSNDKFYFSDLRSTIGSAIAFQQDGSFWVEDPGNCRLQHFSADLKFINRIMYINSSYSVVVDPNNPERVCSDYLEFKVDYSKPLGANNGSWTLVNNWGAMVPAYMDDKYIRLHSLATLSNGRTYTSLYDRQKKKWVVAELPHDGPIRITSAEFDYDNIQLYPDGSLRKMTTIIPSKPVIWSIRPLEKFDANNDIIWGPEKVLANIPVAAVGDPSPRIGANTLHSADITSSNLIVVYGNLTSKVSTPNWHLAAIRQGDHKWAWKTALGTDPTYKGPFPPNGLYDNGNGVRYSGSVALVKDRNIIWGYFGEFWKSSEVNKWNHVYDDGLFVGQFGVTGLDPAVHGIQAPPMTAGNAFAAGLAKDSNGNIYLYHNDESQHGGVHRWKITGLETINEQIINIHL
jgi:hypothetical protein